MSLGMRGVQLQFFNARASLVLSKVCKADGETSRQRVLLLTEMGSFSYFCRLSHCLGAACGKHIFCTSTVVDPEHSGWDHLSITPSAAAHFHSCHGRPLVLNRLLSSYRSEGQCSVVLLGPSSREETQKEPLTLWWISGVTTGIHAYSN